MNPIEVLYSWQALLVACIATAMTQLTKVIIDVVRGHLHVTPTPTVRDAAKVGKGLRESKEELINRVLNRVVIPGLPVLYGTVCALLVPARPEVIMEYTTTHHVVGVGAQAIFGAWGAACGQFADYLFAKAKGAMEVFMRPGSKSAAPKDPGEENAG